MNVREIERASIRQFMEDNKEYLRGRVMDFGAGTQPYKDIVEARSANVDEYIPIEKGDTEPDGKYDTIMCNQVLQYIFKPQNLLMHFFLKLEKGGCLVMTYPTNWDEVDSDDLYRFTKAGMESMLLECGFKIVKHERRADVEVEGFKFPLGYGVVARR